MLLLSVAPLVKMISSAFGTKDLRNLSAGSIHGVLGFLTVDMRPAARVPDLRQIVGPHRLEDSRVDRRCRVVVEVDRFHNLKHLL